MLTPKFNCRRAMYHFWNITKEVHGSPRAGKYILSANKEHWRRMYFYYTGGEVEIYKYSNMIFYSKSMINLNSRQRRIFNKLKNQMDLFETTTLNACGDCIYQNDYILKGVCNGNRKLLV